MYVSKPYFRTRVFFAPANGDGAPAPVAESLPDDDPDGSEDCEEEDEERTLLFWSFHGADEEAREGFVYENEIGGSYSYSKTLSTKIGWREALALLKEIEEEAIEKLAPVDENRYENFRRLHRSDDYDRSAPYQEHPILQREKQIEQLNALSADAPKLQPRRKPPASGGP